MGENKRHLMTTSDKGTIISNCFYCDATPVCERENDDWVVYCGNPECEFKKRFTAPTRDEALYKWDDYIYYDLENPKLKERINFWKGVQDVAKRRIDKILKEIRSRNGGAD